MAVICGTDFSAGAAPATAAAVALAARLGDPELHVVHVLDLAVSSLRPDHDEELRAAAHGLLEAAAADVRRRTRAKVRTALLTGRPAVPALLGYAEDQPAPLLVVASQGHGSSPLYRLGGTSERLAQATRVPLLVVRDALPFEAWARGERRLHVLLGVDWSASCEPAIRWVKERRASALDVTVAHVYYPADERRRYGLPAQRSIVDPDPQAEQLLTRDLAQRVGDLGEAVAFRPTLGFGRPGEALLHLAEAERADVVALGTHRRRGLARLESVASVALHHGRASVLLVPPSEELATIPEEIPPIDRVLIATDLSGFSNRAVPYAYALLKGGGEVHLLHVLSDGRPAGEASEEEATVVAQLRELVPRSAAGAGIVTRTEVVRHHDVARAIAETAERVGASVVVVASHGRSRLASAVLGSVAAALLHESRRPLIVLRPPER